MKRVFQKQKNNPPGGFGLMGVVLTILILAITVTGVMLVLTQATTTRQYRETNEKVAILYEAIKAYRDTHYPGRGAPPDLDVLRTNHLAEAACSFDGTHFNDWCGPYVDVPFTTALNDFKTDGWGSTFYYDSATMLIRSYGPNRTNDNGGVDDIAFSDLVGTP